MAGALPNIAIGPRLREFRIKKDWPLMVGKGIAARARPEKLIKKTLYCVVSSSAWMTELNFQKPLIIKNINKALGTEAIKELVLKPGLLPEKTPPSAPEEAPLKGKLTSAFIDETTSELGDDELKNLIRRVMKKSPF